MGLGPLTAYTESFPPKSKFSVDSIPNLSGKVVIVTGGNAGIGYHTVKALLQHNAKVYLLARSKERASAAISQLKAETDAEAIFLPCDLSSVKSVKEAASVFKSKEKELHILFNSAGVMETPIEALSAEGFDLQFGTNVLGHAVLTIELLPALLAAAQSSAGHSARVVTTSSMSAYYGSLDWDTVKDGEKRRKTNRHMLYAQSKLGCAIFAHELACRYGDKGIISTSCNPGNLRTDLTKNMSPIITRSTRWMLHPAAAGALTQLYAGTSHEGAELNGKWLIPWARLGTTIPKGMQDRELGAKLWEFVEEQVKAIN